MRQWLLLGAALSAIANVPCLAAYAQVPDTVRSASLTQAELTRLQAAQILYEAALRQLPDAERLNTQVQAQQRTIDDLQARVRAGGAETARLRLELATQQEQFVQYSIAAARSASRDLLTLSDSVRNIAATPAAVDALTQFQLGDVRGALVALDDQVRNSAMQRDVAALALEGFHRGHLSVEEVVARYEALVAARSARADDWLRLGQLRLQVGRFSEAAVAFDRARLPSQTRRERAVALLGQSDAEVRALNARVERRQQEECEFTSAIDRALMCAFDADELTADEQLSRRRALEHAERGLRELRRTLRDEPAEISSLDPVLLTLLEQTFSGEADFEAADQRLASVSAEDPGAEDALYARGLLLRLRAVAQLLRQSGRYQSSSLSDPVSLLWPPEPWSIPSWRLLRDPSLVPSTMALRDIRDQLEQSLELARDYAIRNEAHVYRRLEVAERLQLLAYWELLAAEIEARRVGGANQDAQMEDARRRAAELIVEARQIAGDVFARFLTNETALREYSDALRIELRTSTDGKRRHRVEDAIRDALRAAIDAAPDSVTPQRQLLRELAASPPDGISDRDDAELRELIRRLGGEEALDAESRSVLLVRARSYLVRRSQGIPDLFDGTSRVDPELTQSRLDTAMAAAAEVVRLAEIWSVDFGNEWDVDSTGREVGDPRALLYHYYALRDDFVSAADVAARFMGVTAAPERRAQAAYARALALAAAGDFTSGAEGLDAAILTFEARSADVYSDLSNYWKWWRIRALMLRGQIALRRSGWLPAETDFSTAAALIRTAIADRNEGSLFRFPYEETLGSVLMLMADAASGAGRSTDALERLVEARAIFDALPLEDRTPPPLPPLSAILGESTLAEPAPILPSEPARDRTRAELVWENGPPPYWARYYWLLEARERLLVGASLAGLAEYTDYVAAPAFLDGAAFPRRETDIVLGPADRFVLQRVEEGLRRP